MHINENGIDNLPPRFTKQDRDEGWVREVGRRLWVSTLQWGYRPAKGRMN